MPRIAHSPVFRDIVSARSRIFPKVAVIRRIMSSAPSMAHFFFWVNFVIPHPALSERRKNLWPHFEVRTAFPLNPSSGSKVPPCAGRVNAAKIWPIARDLLDFSHGSCHAGVGIALGINSVHQLIVAPFFLDFATDGYIPSADMVREYSGRIGPLVYSIHR